MTFRPMRSMRNRQGYALFRLCKRNGSIFRTTLAIALPCAAISVILHHFYPNGLDLSFLAGEVGLLSETQAWGGFSFLVGFLIVFRTSQAHTRFWEGCTASYRMRTEWFDAICSVVVFTKHSHVSVDEVNRFKELLVRLTSMLHAAALAELEAGENDNAGELWSHSYEIIDPVGVDAQSIETIRRCRMRTELLFTWIQQLIVECIDTDLLTIPAPILSRFFHEMANGMVAFHDAMRIAYVPIPFPYAQSCNLVLILHWILCPLVTAQWVTNAVWAGTFCFIQVYFLWCLNLIAIEIDQPFGKDRNDLDGEILQEELNNQLILLLSPDVQRTPRLSEKWVRDQSALANRTLSQLGLKTSPEESSRRSRFEGKKIAVMDPKSEAPKTGRGRRPSTFGEIFSEHFKHHETMISSEPSERSTQRSTEREGFQVVASASDGMTTYRIDDIRNILNLSEENIAEDVHYRSSGMSEPTVGSLGDKVSSIDSSACELIPDEEDTLDVKATQYHGCSQSSPKKNHNEIRPITPLPSLEPVQLPVRKLPVRQVSTTALVLDEPKKDESFLDQRKERPYESNTSLKTKCPQCGKSLARQPDRATALAKTRQQRCGKCKTDACHIGEADQIICQDCRALFCRQCCGGA